MGLDQWLQRRGEGDWEEVMYWRKANEIHKWFVDNCAGGNQEFNCEYADVTVDQLNQLLLTVEEVIGDPLKAPELLPTQSGFFYGSTEYDDLYWQDLEQTRKELFEILRPLNCDPKLAEMVKFRYTCWW